MGNFVHTLRQASFRTFLWVWFGQVISSCGTAMTRFALLIWAYQQTNSAMTLALLGTFSYIPYLIFSPIAGVVVDRWDRRKIMILADLLAALVTAVLLVFYGMDNLQIWHLYLAEAFLGVFDAFQSPAYSASVSLLVPKEQFARTNGIRSLGYSASNVIAPLLAGALLAWVGITGVMMIDLATFLFSLIVLLLVTIPKPPESTEGSIPKAGFIDEMRTGFRFIFKRPGLKGLMLVMFGINLFASLTYFSILPAMILARSGKSEWVLGIVQSVLGAGSLLGALLLSTWGGPQKKIHSVLACGALSFLLGDLLFGLGRSLLPWVLAALFSTIFIPFISGGQQTIWQMKVQPDLQGRVFSAKDMIQMLVMPLGYMTGGLLADRVFEPAFGAGGALSQTFGWFVGTGPGAGMGAMFVITWLAGTLVCLGGYLFAPLRNVEEELPDMV